MFVNNVIIRNTTSCNQIVAYLNPTVKNIFT